jgi:fluoride exporter
MNVLYLVIGGSLGTIARYYLSGWVSDAAPAAGVGIFVVNITGAFIIGLFLTLSEERFLWPPELRVLVATGFLGAFTTFSTWQWESFQMMQASDVIGATLNLGGSLVCGILAVYAGTLLARAI